MKKKKKDRENLAFTRRKRNEEDTKELITKVENYNTEYTDECNLTQQFFEFSLLKKLNVQRLFRFNTLLNHNKNQLMI